MGKVFELEGGVVLDSDKVIKGLKDLDKQVDETGKNLEKTETASGKLKKAFTGLGKTIASTFAFSKIKDFSKECVEAANYQIQAETKLQTVYEATGRANADQIQSLKDYASELQGVGVIGKLHCRFKIALKNWKAKLFFYNKLIRTEVI